MLKHNLLKLMGSEYSRHLVCLPDLCKVSQDYSHPSRFLLTIVFLAATFLLQVSLSSTCSSAGHIQDWAKKSLVPLKWFDCLKLIFTKNKLPNFQDFLGDKNKCILFHLSDFSIQKKIKKHCTKWIIEFFDGTEFFSGMRH